MNFFTCRCGRREARELTFGAYDVPGADVIRCAEHGIAPCRCPNIYIPNGGYRCRTCGERGVLTCDGQNTTCTVGRSADGTWLCRWHQTRLSDGASVRVY